MSEMETLPRLPEHLFATYEGQGRGRILPPPDLSRMNPE